MIVVELIRSALSFLVRHKWKWFALVLWVVIFSFLLFPFNDLGDLVSTQTARFTNNNLFLSFEKLKMSLFPEPGMEFEQVYIESSGAPAISAQQLVILPSVSGLLYQKPFGSASIKGLLKGNVDLRIGSGKRSERGIERYRIEMKAQKISLQELRQMANLPVFLKGQLSVESKMLADLTLQEQPEIPEMSLSLRDFEMPPFSLNVQGLDVSLPSVRVSEILLKGRLSEGRFFIESGKIGKPGDEIVGTLNGWMSLNFQNDNGVPSPRLGPYEFLVDLTINRNFQEKAGGYLLLLDSYKRPLSTGAQYKLKISGDAIGLPPRLSNLQ